MPPAPDLRAGERVTVAATPENAANTFWQRLPGELGTVTAVDADGLISVALDRHGLVEGVHPDRFALIPTKPRPWWRFW